MPPQDPARLTVRFWGVRGSIPTPQPGHLGVGGNTSCVEVRSADGTVLVLDAGTGARPLGYALAAEAAGEPMKIHVALSHFHWDHLQGLPFFAPLFAAGHEVTFYAVTDDDRLDRLLQGQMCFPYFPVPFGDLAAATQTVSVREGEPFTVGPMTVRPFPVNHPQGAHGFRIECAGATVVYATDYEHGVPRFDAGLREAARGADLLISDAQYTPDEYTASRRSAIRGAIWRAMRSTAPPPRRRVSLSIRPSPGATIDRRAPPGRGRSSTRPTFAA